MSCMCVFGWPWKEVQVQEPEKLFIELIGIPHRKHPHTLVPHPVLLQLNSAESNTENVFKDLEHTLQGTLEWKIFGNGVLIEIMFPFSHHPIEIVSIPMTQFLANQI